MEKPCQAHECRKLAKHLLGRDKVYPHRPRRRVYGLVRVGDQHGGWRELLVRCFATRLSGFQRPLTGLRVGQTYSNEVSGMN